MAQRIAGGDLGRVVTFSDAVVAVAVGRPSAPEVGPDLGSKT